jgi:hypothetical protein
VKAHGEAAKHQSFEEVLKDSPKRGELLFGVNTRKSGLSGDDVSLLSTYYDPGLRR